MNHQNHKIINFNAYQSNVVLWQVTPKQNQHQYQCLLSGDRLQGDCELLLYNVYQRTAELYCLHFSGECEIVLQYFQEEEVLLWKQYRTVERISYHQAMTLLGDAVRRMYQEQNGMNQWNASHTSIHVQRTWMSEYYNNENSSLGWLLDEREYIPFINQYFCAVNNKDAVLLYDMMTSTRKKAMPRELYAFNWNHVLEEVDIIDFAVIDGRCLPDESAWRYYLTICGERPDGTVLLVDICLHLAMENGYVRLQDEYVLDASHIVSCCREI